MTSLLSPADKETVTTVTTTIEIELQRTETVTKITCPQCARPGEVRKVEFTPPASVGSSVVSCRVPDGWWIQGASYFNFKGTCPDCFEKRSSGVRARRAESAEASAPSTRDEALPAVDSDRDRVRPGDSAWQTMLSTPGGASAVAKALASHLRQTAESIRGTSLPRIVETLEAASARLEEFRPKDAADVDLTPLGERPFAAPFEPQAIIEADAPEPRAEAPEPHQDTLNPGAAQDLFTRIERVCQRGGNLFVSGSLRDTTSHACVTMSNDRGIELTATAEGTTMAAALESALAKAGL